MKIAYAINDQIDNLREVGELVETDKEVDWNYEILACAFIDATWRLDRPEETILRRVDFEVMFAEEIKEKVKKLGTRNSR